MLLLPKLVTLSYLSRLGDRANQMTVRIHTGLVQKYQRWTKLWYFLRGLNRSNSGFGRILMTDICYWLGAAPSTVRQWFKEGKAAGAFRFWAERRGVLTVSIGSPTAVCIGLELWLERNPRPRYRSPKSIRQAWGTVSEISVFELDRLRQHATAVSVQHLQSQSHFAAKIRIPKVLQERYRIPNPEEFFNQEERASLNPGVRALLPFCLKITPSRIWVSKSFRPFGVRQTTVARIRGFCDRTIRNHLSTLGVERKQIVQSKAVYGEVVGAIASGATYRSWGEGKEQVTLVGDVLYGPPQISGPAQQMGMEHRLCEGGEGDFPQGGIATPKSRFFKSWGKWWMYRCNLYNLNYQLHSMEFARDKWYDVYVFELPASQDHTRLVTRMIDVVSLNKSSKIEAKVACRHFEDDLDNTSDYNVNLRNNLPPENLGDTLRG